MPTDCFVTVAYHLFMPFFNFADYKQHYIQLIKIGLPIVLGQVGVIVLGFADTIMIGHHTTVELAAASLVNNIFNLAIIFGTGFAYGLTPLVGELFGRGDRDKIGALLKVSLLANTIVALIITAVMTVVYLNIDNMGQPDELMKYVKPYYIIILVSIFFVMIFNSFKQFADGITDTRTAMWLLIIGNVMNIAGNYVLIYGKFGCPELGLVGAGLSTLASRVAMVLLFVIIFVRSERYAVYRRGFAKASFDRVIFRRLNSLGWPVAFQMGMEGASFNLSAIMVGWLGSLALAAHQIAVTFSTLSYMVIYGMGAATSIRVSYFVGQSDYVSVRRSAFAGFHLSMVIIIMVSIVFALLRNDMGYWFTDNAEVAAITSGLVFIVMLYQFGDATQIVFANSLRGISDVKPMMFIAFFAYFVVSLPVGYFLGFVVDLGIYGIWLAYPIGLTTAGVLFFLRFNRKTSLTKVSRLSS